MRLQQQDFISAWAIQKELVKLVPGDQTIAAFSQYLPAEVDEQKQAQKDAEGEESYYDEEDDNEASDSEEEVGVPDQKVSQRFK